MTLDIVNELIHLVVSARHCLANLLQLTNQVSQQRRRSTICTHYELYCVVTSSKWFVVYKEALAIDTTQCTKRSYLHVAFVAGIHYQRNTCGINERQINLSVDSCCMIVT